MLEPAEVELSCIVGATYFDTYQFWADSAQTVPYDFSEWTGFTLVIGTETLTTNNGGLTIDAEAGQISPLIASSVTSGLRPDVVRYALSAADPAGHVGFLMIGNFVWASSNE